MHCLALYFFPPLLLDCCTICTQLYRFVNRDDIDFGLAHDLPAVQTLEMVRDSGGVEVRRSLPTYSSRLVYLHLEI